MAMNGRNRKGPLRLQMVLGFHFTQNSSFSDEIADEMDGFGYMYWTGPDPRAWNDVEDEDEDKPGYEETLGAKRLHKCINTPSNHSSGSLVSHQTSANLLFLRQHSTAIFL